MAKPPFPWIGSKEKIAPYILQVSSKNGSVMNYSLLTVEKRKYEEYMIYGPIPFAEVMKWSNLEQNVGWK